MDSAVELINNFVSKTTKLCAELNKFDTFEYDHSISATVDCHTIEVIKIHQLEELCGFFLATAEFKSESFKFVINYGDIDYGLFYTVYIDDQRYSYNCYTHSILGEESPHCSSLRSIENMDSNLDKLLSILMETYPLLLQKKDLSIEKMDKYNKVELKKEKEDSTRQTAAAQIRKANIFFIENNYCEAYKIYNKHKEFLTKPDLVKMEHCKKNM